MTTDLTTLGEQPTGLSAADWQRNYDTLKTLPGPRSVFELVVSRGWLPADDLANYRIYGSWSLAGPEAQARAGLFAFWALVQRIHGTTQNAARGMAAQQAPGLKADLAAWTAAIDAEYEGSPMAGDGPAPIPTVQLPGTDLHVPTARAPFPAEVQHFLAYLYRTL